MSEIAIKFEDISKQYRLGRIGTGTISHDLKRWWIVNVLGKEDPYLKIGQANDQAAKADGNLIWALKNIDLEVKKGEVLGIIGKNGAGKSTLLKILSRVTAPTTGRITAYGRIASLLEVGTGFHPEMTGRENIYMNGSIMGMTKLEITRKLDEIVEFAGIAKYVDTPAKRYSSGMTVRLGFAIAAHLEPEILVVDEVLAVGDAEFQKKAIGKMNDVSRNAGRTVLFVSHNMSSIKTLCHRGILLTNGKLSFDGHINSVIDEYLHKDSYGNTASCINEFNKEFNHESQIKLTELKLFDVNDRTKTHFSQTEDILLGIKYQTYNNVRGLRFNLALKTMHGEVVFKTTSHSITKDDINAGAHVLKLTIPGNLLNSTRYMIAISADIPGENVLISQFSAFTLDIEGFNSHGSDYNEKWEGIIAPKLKWEKCFHGKNSSV